MIGALLWLPAGSRSIQSIVSSNTAIFCSFRFMSFHSLYIFIDFLLRLVPGVCVMHPVFADNIHICVNK